MAHVSGRSEIFHLITDKQPGCPADFHPGTKSPALEPGVEGLSRDVEQAAGLRSRKQLPWDGGSDFHRLYIRQKFYIDVKNRHSFAPVSMIRPECRNVSQFRRN